MREMQKSLLEGAEKTVQNLGELNRQLRRMCDTCAEHVVSRTQLPRDLVGSVPDGSPLGKAPSEFAAPEEYAFFALLSIAIQQINERIFQPFHPYASLAENESYSRTYQGKMNSGEAILSPYVSKKLTYDI